MNLSLLHHHFRTNRQHSDEYTRLELDQHSRMSRIRRETQAFDEALAHKAVVINSNRNIA